MNPIEQYIVNQIISLSKYYTERNHKADSEMFKGAVSNSDDSFVDLLLNGGVLFDNNGLADLRNAIMQSIDLTKVRKACEKTIG